MQDNYQILEEYKGVPSCYAPSQEAWRSWLEENHKGQKGVWLIIFRKEGDTPSVQYPEAVEEALCFAWIDSKPNKRDEKSYYQYFSPRKPKSNWSRVNKEKVARLIQEGRMQAAGMAMVDLAQKTGTWDALEDVENLVIPEDLGETLDRYPQARANFEAFPRSVKRSILEWILLAKRAETRKKRIEETAEKAQKNERANQYRK